MKANKIFLVLALVATLVAFASPTGASTQDCGIGTSCWDACEDYCTYGCDGVTSSLNCESPYCAYDCKTASEADSTDLCQGTCDYDVSFTYQPQPTSPQEGTLNIGASKCGQPVNAYLDITGRQSWQGNLGHNGHRSLNFYKGNYNVRASYQGDERSRSVYLSCSETENIQFSFPSTQKLTIKAVDDSGQPLDSFVKVRGSRKNWEGNLGANGKVTLTVPADDYDIYSNYQGNRKQTEVSVGCDESKTVKFTYHFCENPSLTVKTRDEYGNSVNARVSIEGPEFESFYTGYSGQGTKKLEPGNYQVTAEYEGQTRSKSVSLDCGDSRRVDFTFSTCEDGSLNIETVDQDGNDVDAYVEVRGPDDWTGKVGSDGYKSLGMKAGDYVITAEYQGETLSKHVSVPCGGSRRAKFTFEEECKDASLTIRATKDRGTNVDAHIKVRGPDDRTFGLGSSGFRTITLASGNYDLTAEYGGQSISRRVGLGCGESKQEDFSFSTCEDASLTLKTIDQTGGLVDAHVRIRGPDDRSIRTGAGGLRTLNLKPGAYDVVASHDDKTRSRHTRLSCGQSRRLVFSFSQCGDSTLTIRTMNQEGEGVNAFVKLEGSRNRVFYIGDGGLRTLNLPAGDYDITSKYQGETKSKHICLGCGSSQVCGISKQLDFRFEVDSEAPKISGLQPRGEIDCEDDMELRVRTDEWATCAYTDHPFSFASGTIFSQTQGTYHSTSVSAEPGENYDYYVKCRDREDNTNQNAARIHFSCQEDTKRVDSQGNAKVIVRGEEDRIKNARVSLEKVGGIVEKVAYTNLDGKAIFTGLSEGLYVARAEKDGYEAGESGGAVEKGKTTTIQIELGKEKLDLDIIARGAKGKRLTGARLKVRSVDGDYSESERTNYFGRAHFPDLERGRYDIKVSKYTYETLTDTITLSRSQEESYVLRKKSQYQEEETEEKQAKGDELKIRSIVFPDKVTSCSQQQLQAKIKNTASQSQEVQVKVKVLGQTYRSHNSHVLSRGQEKWFKVPISIPAQAGGAESLQVIAVSEDNKDTATFSFDVRNVYGSVNVNPSEVTVGEQVQVYGTLSTSDTEVDIYLDGRRMKSVVSDSGGHYQAYLRPYISGQSTVSIKLDCGQTLAREKFTINPDIKLDLTQWREKVAVGEQFEVCAEAQAQSGAMVYLLKDDSTVQSRRMRSSDERICFKTSLSDKGEHKISFKLDAITKGRQVTAIEPKTEVKIFPTDLQLGLGGSGVVRVRLTNSGLSSKTYRVGVSGFDPDWISSPVDTVTLQPGDRRDIFLHLNPHQAGSHRGSVRVMVNGDMIEEEFIKLYVTSKSSLGINLLENVYGVFSTYLIYVLAVIFLLGTGYGLYRGFFVSESLEPRYE